jgi:hypothetical protein
MMTTTTTVPLSPVLIEAFMSIANALSPENLMMDGECSMAAARRVKASLKARWRELEKVAGRPVTEDEVWAAFLTTPRTTRLRTTFR